jgi:uncharacterized protein (TIGR02246 family)
MNNEAAIRTLVVNWAEAVRREDRASILRDHAENILMFDVPPPVQLKGLDAYARTWDAFFAWSKPVGFEITEMHVTAGDDVAFATALIRCSGTEATGERTELNVRLTVGLQKNEGRWTVVHEHHSIPAAPNP